MKRIRVYGASIGHGSMARVAAGVTNALSRVGQLAGFVPCDAFDEEAAYEGADAPEGVVIGPAFLQRAIASGWHRRVHVLLPPNSTWLPEATLRAIARANACVIAPSTWAERMIRDAWERLGLPDLYSSRWLHGVDTVAFCPDFTDAQERREEYERGEFRALHLASECAERKSTRAVVEAWLSAVDAGRLGARPSLTLLVDATPQRLTQWLASSSASAMAKASIRWQAARMDLSPKRASALYRSAHCLVQPSRSEGFGLCPLEALASGVPVVATACTGHADYLPRPGAVIVPHGGYEPVNDGPDGAAPSVATEAIADAMAQMFATWESVHVAALQAREVLSAHWSWVEVTRLWLSVEDWRSREA